MTRAIDSPPSGLLANAGRNPAARRTAQRHDGYESGLRDHSADFERSWKLISITALSTARSVAAAWRAGLTTLIPLVTIGIILKGRAVTTNLSPLWRIAVMLAIGLGLAMVILGLWHALAAEVGARTRLHALDNIRALRASVQAYQVGEAVAAGRRSTQPTHGPQAQGLDRRRPRLRASGRQHADPVPGTSASAYSLQPHLQHLSIG